MQKIDMPFIPSNKNERTALISELARKLHSESPYSSNLDNWLRAEKNADELIIKNSSSIKDIYKTIMVKFFSSTDKDNMSNEDFAKKYLDFFYQNADLYESLKAIKKNDEYYRNISLLINDMEFDSLTKKSLLLANTTLFGHNNKITDVYYKHEMSNVDITGEWANDTLYYSNCPNYDYFGRWLKECEPLLMIGDLFYLPKIQVKGSVGCRQHEAMENMSIIFEDSLFDSVVESKRVVKHFTGQKIKSNFINTIVQIEIPFMENIGLEMLSKISIDEYDKLKIFRDEINRNFLDIISSGGNELEFHNIEKISLKLKKEINTLKSDFISLNRTTAIQVSGAVIGTVMATLVAINANMFEEIAKIASISGGLGITISTLNEYLNKKQKNTDSPYYFIWLLS